jgi:hypothetical protein
MQLFLQDPDGHVIELFTSLIFGAASLHSLP